MVSFEAVGPGEVAWRPCPSGFTGQLVQRCLGRNDGWAELTEDCAIRPIMPAQTRDDANWFVWALSAVFSCIAAGTWIGCCRLVSKCGRQQQIGTGVAAL